MNREDDPCYFYGNAWSWILEAAQSVIEDDLNEQGMDQAEYEETVAACFDIFNDAESYARYL